MLHYALAHIPDADVWSRWDLHTNSWDSGSEQRHMPQAIMALLERSTAYRTSDWTGINVVLMNSELLCRAEWMFGD
jgi:hypothetical protein